MTTGVTNHPPWTPGEQIGIAFYGRTSASDPHDAAAAQYQQQICLAAVAATFGNPITDWSFDRACRADLPFPHRPQGRRLLAALALPACRIHAAVPTDPACIVSRRTIGETSSVLCAFADRQVQLLLAGTGLLIGSPVQHRLMMGMLSGPMQHERSR